MPTILIHIQNEDSMVGEVDQLPASTDNFITIKNPRRRDGKDITNLEANVTTIMLPITRINLVEILPTADEEQIIGFVRE
jgi:hypothetical protein